MSGFPPDPYRMQGHVTMSTQELDRLQVLARVADKRLTQCEAAAILGVTDRQLRQIRKRYQARAA